MAAIGSSFDNPLAIGSVAQESVTSGVFTQRTRSARQSGAPADSQTGKEIGGATGSSNNPGFSPEESQSYRVTISEEALRRAGLLKDDPAKSGKPGAPADNNSAASKKASAAVDPQQALALENLKRTDRDVRAHEQAHIMAGGSLVRGGATFGYVSGPDGKLYAVSGEVSIDTSPVQDDPEATSRKMVQVAKAALAPAQPSGQDRSVASEATKMEVEANRQVSQQQMEKMQGSDMKSDTAPAGAPEPSKGAPETKPRSSEQEPSRGNPGSAVESSRVDTAGQKREYSLQTRRFPVPEPGLYRNIKA